MSETPRTPSTPGSLAIENIKNRDKQLIEFKVPANSSVKKKHKPKILTEEKYIEELAKIVQRDFFPDLDKLRAQNDYLDAMDRNDYTAMAAIRAKYSGSQPSPAGRNSSMSPATFETPIRSANNTPVPKKNSSAATDTPQSTISSTSSSKSVEGKNKSLIDKHSLDSFLHAYTSEDNYSFQEIIDTADEKLRQKFSVFYNQEKLSAEKLARALTLPSIEKQFEEPDPMRKIETWTYTNMNSIMYTPDGVELTKNERIDAAKRKQIIQHSATRLAMNPFDDAQNQKAVSDAAKQHSQSFSDRVGVDGNVIGPKAAQAGEAGPQIRGFNLMKTPSPRPGEAFSPLMTWGEIEGTPFRLDGSDTPIRSNAGPSFKITENSRRENIAIALAEKVGEKMRAQKQHAMDVARKNMGSPFIRSNAERLASISPAARQLASAKLGLRTSLMTPSPIRTPNLGGRARKTRSISKTPSLAIKTPELVVANKAADTSTVPSSKNLSSGESTLTDDLLKIPTKRLKASDFF